MNYNRKIHIENIVKEETVKANDKLGFLNNITSVCIKKGLTSSEYIEVYEKVIRNMMQICKSRLENSFVNKRRYKEEIKLSPIKANEDTISDYKLNLANDILVKHSLGLATLFPDED